jgi:hypothetical protein
MLTKIVLFLAIIVVLIYRYSCESTTKKVTSRITVGEPNSITVGEPNSITVGELYPLPVGEPHPLPEPKLVAGENDEPNVQVDVSSPEQFINGLRFGTGVSNGYVSISNSGNRKFLPPTSY